MKASSQGTIIAGVTPAPCTDMEGMAQALPIEQVSEQAPSASDRAMLDVDEGTSHTNMEASEKEEHAQPEVLKGRTAQEHERSRSPKRVMAAAFSPRAEDARQSLASALLWRPSPARAVCKLPAASPRGLALVPAAS